MEGQDSAKPREKKGNPTLKADIMVALKNGPMNRDKLVHALKVPRTTIYDALKRLMIEGDVKKSPFYTETQHRGRPTINFSIIERKDNQDVKNT